MNYMGDGHNLLMPLVVLNHYLPPLLMHINFQGIFKNLIS